MGSRRSALKKWSARALTAPEAAGAGRTTAVMAAAIVVPGCVGARPRVRKAWGFFR